MLQDEPTEVVRSRVEAACGPVAGLARLGGGDVAESFAVDLRDGGRVFAKTHRDPPPDFFDTEAQGLEWLRAADAVAVPTVLFVDDAVLVLEWIDEQQRHPDEARFGAQLAGLHRAGAPCFGRTDRRTTGSRRLPNEPSDTWSAFFASNRLLPLARLARDTRSLSERACADMEALAGRLDELGVPDESPARLHGDLWAGNRVVAADGTSWLIDPAAHGGHREFDLAMMLLFGGFGEGSFEAYDQTQPLAPGWRARVPLHQLAPLAVHAIKFGGGYGAATERALDAASRLG
jgi:fructosamine-3-kinase